METRAGYVAVGAFVLVLIACLAGFVIWLGGFQGREGFAYYDVLFRGSVTGLNVDGPVRYRGIAVGRVADIRIDAEDIALVRVTLEVQRGTPMRADSVASLEMQGITGVAYVLISGGTQTSEPLPETDDRPYPILASKASKLEELFEGAPNLLAQMQKLVDRVQVLFSEENTNAIGETLANLQIISEALAANSGGLADLFVSGTAAADQVQTMAAELQALALELREAVDQVQDGSVDAVKEVRATASAFRSLAEELDIVIAENRKPLQDFTVGGLYELSQLLTEVRLLVSSMSRISSQIERDPARFLFGDRLRGYEAQ